MGWNSIIYLSALAGIDPEYYEGPPSSMGRAFRQLWNITLPGIVPTIVVMLILRAGQIMNVGFEKIILLYNSNTYETGDVISSFVYVRDCWNPTTATVRRWAV
jgi:putative aldouronate transport system permease protein